MARQMIEENKIKQEYFKAVRHHLIPILHEEAGIPRKSEVNKEGVQKFIKAGAKVFSGVMSNLWRDEKLGFCEIVQKLLVYGDVLLRRIYHINRKLRENKLPDRKVFKDFACHLKDEIVSKFSQDCELVRHFKRKIALWKSTEPTFTARGKRVLEIFFEIVTSKIFVCILTCYLIFLYRNVSNSGH